jgi:type II secretory pathway component PulM
MSMLRLPARLGTVWDRASPRERMLLACSAAVLTLAVLYVIAWQPLVRDVDRTREALQRDRATLATLAADVQPARDPALAPDPAPAALRGAVERALEVRGLRGAAAQLEVREGRVSLLLSAVPFDVLARLLGELQRNDRVRVIEARLTARVEPGQVRAELTLGR